MSATREDARRSFLWSFVEKWVAYFTQLVVFVLLGRLLAPEDFGLVALATAYITFVKILTDSGFGKALVQKEDLSPRDISTAFGVSLSLGATLCVATVLLAPHIAQAFHEPDLSALLSFMSIVVLLDGIDCIPAFLLERQLRFKALAIRRTISAAVGGVVAVVMAFSGFGVWSLAVQAVVTEFVSTIIIWGAYRSWPGLRPYRHSFVRLRRTGFSVVGIDVLGFFNAQADKLIIGTTLGVEVLGYYFLAMRVVSITGELFTSVFSRVSLAIFSRLQSDVPAIRRWLEKLTTGTTLLTVPVFCFYGLFSSELLLTVFGPQWRDSADILEILIFLGAINSMLIFDRGVLLALGRPVSVLVLTAGQSGLGIVLLLISAPLGIFYVSLAVVLRQYLFWPARLVVLKRVVHIDVFVYIRDWLICFVLTVAVLVLGQVIDVWRLPTRVSATLKIMTFLVVFGGAYVILFRAMLGEMVRLALYRSEDR